MRLKKTRFINISYLRKIEYVDFVLTTNNMLKLENVIKVYSVISVFNCGVQLFRSFSLCLYFTQNVYLIFYRFPV